MLNNIRPGTYRRRIIKIKKPIWNFEADVIILFPFNSLLSPFSRGFPFSEYKVLRREADPNGTYFLVRTIISATSRAEAEEKIMGLSYVERVRSLRLLGKEEGSAG
jgi:hypothetical protein